jgi:AraC-like DNA-binding protein
MRQLERRFDRAVGLPPKIVDRIFRFQRLLHTLQAPRDTAITVRPSHGYYDESHLIREFKTFTGQTPADYAADWHALSDRFIGRP